MFATLALLVAAFITLGMGMATSFFTAAPLRGPDTMGYAMVFLALGIRWAFVLIAILVALAQGKFAWVSARPAMAGFIVIACHAGLGVVASAAWMAWTGNARWFTVAAGNLGAIAMPLIVQGYVLAHVWATPGHVAGAVWTRVLGWPMLVIGAVGLAGGAALLVQWQIQAMNRQEARIKEREDAILQNEIDRIAREKQQAEELAALPDDAPLDQFVTHLFIDKSDAHVADAARRIRGLPNLTARIEEAIVQPDPRRREYISNFIRTCENPDPAWIPAVARSMDVLAADITAAPALYDPQTMLSYRGLVQGSLMTARRFPDHDFGAQVRSIRAALMTKEEGQVRHDALDLLERFESGRPLTDPK